MAGSRTLVADRIVSAALTALWCLAFLPFTVAPADAKARTGARTNQIRFAYVPPKDPAHQQIFEQLRKQRILETLAEILGPLRLPAPLTLKLEGCDGVSNAWYEERTVTVCYEYIHDAIRNAPTETTAGGVTRQDAIVGPTIEVFLHEVGHAAFDMLHVPLFGREEDAADQFAAFMLLRLSNKDMRPVMRGIAYMYAQEARSQTPGLKSFADVHGLPAQRMFNLICLAYGAHPRQFADVVEKGYLPKERSESCAEEYDQVAYAFGSLIGPHIDQKLRAKVMAKFKKKRWIKPAPAMAPGATPPKG